MKNKVIGLNKIYSSDNYNNISHKSDVTTFNNIEGKSPNIEKTLFSLEKLYPRDEIEGLQEGIVKTPEGDFIFQIVPINKDLRAEHVIPTESLALAKNFPDSVHQKLTSGRMVGTEIEPALDLWSSLSNVGGELMGLLDVSKVVFITDASNFPFNEGHFVIREGQVVKLPKNLYQPAGKHFFMCISKSGEVSFKAVDLDEADSYKDIWQAFMVPVVMYKGETLQLLDKIPQTDTYFISEVRGHIGQIFDENSYSEKGEPKKAFIHEQIIKWLREPDKYLLEIKKALKGGNFYWGELNGVKIEEALPRMIYNHTYWVETKDGELLLIKIYPKENAKSGVKFEDSGALLKTILNPVGKIPDNAYIGTNGRDVRLIVPNDGTLRAISETAEGLKLDFKGYLERGLGNFIVFKK